MSQKSIFPNQTNLVEEIDQEPLGRHIPVNKTWIKSDRPTKMLVRLNQLL